VKEYDDGDAGWSSDGRHSQEVSRLDHYVGGVQQEIHSGETLDEQEANDSVGRSRPREANVAGDREVVDGTSGAARSAAVAVTGVGDGLVGAVVGGLSGAVNGLTGGMGAVRGVAPGVAVAAAGVAAGALGLVDWPLLVLAGGAALVVRQLRATPASSRAGAVPTRKTTPATAKATASRPRATATTRKTSTPAKRASRKRPNPSTSASSGSGE